MVTVVLVHQRLLVNLKESRFVRSRRVLQRFRVLRSRKKRMLIVGVVRVGGLESYTKRRILPVLMVAVMRGRMMIYMKITLVRISSYNEKYNDHKWTSEY